MISPGACVVTTFPSQDSGIRMFMSTLVTHVHMATCTSRRSIHELCCYTKLTPSLSQTGHFSGPTQTYKPQPGTGTSRVCARVILKVFHKINKLITCSCISLITYFCMYPLYPGMMDALIPGYTAESLVYPGITGY